MCVYARYVPVMPVTLGFYVGVFLSPDTSSVLLPELAKFVRLGSKQ
jgi:hypothetical protein